MPSTEQALAQTESGCVIKNCHSEMLSKQFIHGPVAAGACLICHSQIEGKDHDFELIAEDEELCFGCHDKKREMMMEEHLHTPVSEGLCTECHDPHQSDYQYNLIGQAADLCYNCHDELMFQMEFIHGPVGVGDCVVCHNPHASPNEKQLNYSIDEICFTCHKEKKEIMDKQHIHKPVFEKCTNCHNPHSNKTRYMLDSKVPQLCFGCHQNIEENINTSHKHPPAAEGQCLKCHDVHSSNNPRMFQKPLQELCFSCHTEMEQFMSSKEFKHGPVIDGDCSACHNPHGSDNWRILRKYFPSEFYKPFVSSNYALCFECHPENKVLLEKTTTVTDFRNKDINLHFVHVNKKVKGRSCRACHQVHASNQERHIRESVPFGNIGWELPIKYTKYDDGGKCVVGCHAPREYHRD